MDLSGYLYHCSAGETFDEVSLAVYGDERYATELMTANPDLVTTAVFVGGEVLALPVVEQAGDTAESTAPTTAPWKL